MKLAAIYNVWDGLELLEGSIRQIEGEVDKIIVVFQNTSNFGNTEPVDRQLSKILSNIDKEVHTVHYFPDLEVSASMNEILKRQKGIEKAKELNCTHFLLMDCDEYYKTDDFRKARQEVDKNNYKATACELYTYYKYPTWRLEPKENYYVPFIHELCEDTKLGGSYEITHDPTRGVQGIEVPVILDINMHHFSWVREDIRKKLENSSANVNWYEKIDEFVDKYDRGELAFFDKKGYTIKEVDNLFKI